MSDTTQQLYEALPAKKEWLKYNKLHTYSPYLFQTKFHNDKEKFRANVAGNRPGKTLSGAAEMAYHLTGNYPDWWKGRRYDHPVLGLAGGKNNEKTRDLIQKELFGDPADDK